MSADIVESIGSRLTMMMSADTHMTRHWFVWCIAAFGEASAAIPMAPYSIPSLKSPKTFRPSNAPTSHKPQAAENEAPVTATAASAQRLERGTATAEAVKQEPTDDDPPPSTLPVRLAIDMQPPGVPKQQQQQLIRGSLSTANAAQVELLPADGHPDVKQETPPGPSVPAGPSTSSRKNRKCDFLPTDSDYEEMQSNQGDNGHPLQGRDTAEEEVVESSRRRNRRAILFGSDSEEEEMQSDDEESQSEDDEEMHSEDDEEMQSEDEDSQSDDDAMQSGEDEETQSNQGGNHHPPEGQDAAEEEDEEGSEEGQVSGPPLG